MNKNKKKINEDLGIFGGAVKNGWLKPHFKVEEVVMDVYEGKPCLKCHMGRWFGRDDDIILLPDGTGINVDPNAKNDKRFKWKSIRALHTSFAKAILWGAGIGAAAGSGVGALGGKLGWWGGAAAKGTTAMSAPLTKPITIIPQASRTIAALPPHLNEEETNEVANFVIGGGIGAALGALGGGIYALIKNRDDVIYYSDGSYVSRKGTVEGRWDGSVEEAAAKEEKNDGNTGNTVTPVTNIPGMPSDFARNPENVKIAQRYLVANHANISTSKSVDGIDGKLGPRTKKAILAFMNQYNCDFAKFWADAQEYEATKKRVEDMRVQNLKASSDRVSNLKITSPQLSHQSPLQTTATQDNSTVNEVKRVETIEEVKNRFYDIFNRMNNATILQ